MRRDGCGAGHASRRDPLERRRVAGRAARALRRRRARGRVARGTSSSSRPVVREALAEADATLDDVGLVAVTRRPRARSARCSSALSAAKALAWGRGLPLAPVDHLHGHVASLYLEPDPLEPPVPLPARDRRAHAAPRRPRPGRLPHRGDDDRRRRRRGVRQGRAPARPRLPGRRRARPARRGRRSRRRSTSRSRGSTASTSPSPA